MSKNKYVNFYLKYFTLLTMFVCLNTWSLFQNISLCALLISRLSYNQQNILTNPELLPILKNIESTPPPPYITLSNTQRPFYL